MSAPSVVYLTQQPKPIPVQPPIAAFSATSVNAAIETQQHFNAVHLKILEHRKKVLCEQEFSNSSCKKHKKKICDFMHPDEDPKLWQVSTIPPNHKYFKDKLCESGEKCVELRCQGYHPLEHRNKIEHRSVECWEVKRWSHLAQKYFRVRIYANHPRIVNIPLFSEMNQKLIALTAISMEISRKLILCQHAFDGVVCESKCTFIHPKIDGEKAWNITKQKPHEQFKRNLCNNRKCCKVACNFFHKGDFRVATEINGEKGWAYYRKHPVTGTAHMVQFFALDIMNLGNVPIRTVYPMEPSDDSGLKI